MLTITLWGTVKICRNFHRDGGISERKIKNSGTWHDVLCSAVFLRFRWSGVNLTCGAEGKSSKI